jgi:hypothetical protein
MSKLAIKEQANSSGVVRDRTFEDCEVIGPATIVPIGTDNAVIDCSYRWSLESLSQSRMGPGVRDVVFLIACTFRRCSFDIDVDASRLFASEAS